MKKIILMVVMAVTIVPLWAESTPQEIYEQGNQYYAQMKFDDAINKYREVATNYPTSSVASKAQYSIAGIYLIKLEYTKAIEEGKKFIMNYSNNIMVPDALKLI